MNIKNEISNIKSKMNDDDKIDIVIRKIYDSFSDNDFDNILEHIKNGTPINDNIKDRYERVKSLEQRSKKYQRMHRQLSQLSDEELDRLIAKADEVLK